MAGLDKAFGTSKNPKTIYNVKNPEIQTRLGTSIKDYDTVKSSGASALGDYITEYFSNDPAARTRTGQEISNLDRYFDGGAAGELAGLRSSRAAAVQSAADRAAEYALANVSRSRAMGEGGPSSWDKRLALKSTGDIFTQAAIDNALQERNDWDFLERSRLSTTGQRTALDDALAGRSLVPEMARRKMFGEDLGFLNQLMAIDQGNKFYGLKNRPGIGESFVGDYGSVMDAY